MSQSRANLRRTILPLDLKVLSFETDLGWMAFVHRDCENAPILELNFGFHTEDAARGALTLTSESSQTPSRTSPSRSTEWARRLIRYASSEVVSLREIRLDLSHLTRFSRLVVAACREIPRGCTQTYSQVATTTGNANAARAVGSVMARNRTPLIIPCHRVVAANGGAGGFSAAGGVTTKRHLLEMESLSGEAVRPLRENETALPT